MYSIKIDDILDKVDRGKIHAMLDFPMIEGDVSKMRVIVTTNVKTASTDGNTVWVNPHFINALSPFETEFVVLHEWGHVFLKHFSRSIKLDDKELVQIATDQEVNNLLKRANVPILDSALCDPQFSDMTMEQIYRYLKDNQEQGDTEGERNVDGGVPVSEPDEPNESGEATSEPAGPQDDEVFQRGEEVVEISDYQLPDVSEWASRACRLRRAGDDWIRWVPKLGQAQQTVRLDGYSHAFDHS